MRSVANYEGLIKTYFVYTEQKVFTHSHIISLICSAFSADLELYFYNLYH